MNRDISSLTVDTPPGSPSSSLDCTSSALLPEAGAGGVMWADSIYAAELTPDVTSTGTTPGPLGRCQEDGLGA